jgi:hypothetical protein
MKEAMKLALEALIRSKRAVSEDLDLAGCAYGSVDSDGHRYADAKKALSTLKQAIKALEEALAQDMPKIGCVNHDCEKCKEQGEPVAWMRQDGQRVTTASDCRNGG